MFDKLVESASTGAEFKPRRRIFVASFFFVAVLFATAVVASIYAADFDLGNDNFDLAQLLSPITDSEPQPEPEPEQRYSTQASTSDRPTRVMNILRIEETPTTAPVISTERSPYQSRPEGYFRLDPRGTDSNGPPADLGNLGPGGPGSSRNSNPSFQSESDPVTTNPPPAPPKVEKPTTKSLGVINGRASSLPHPPYPPMAKAVGADGPVNVQVMIDEDGNVVSAKAVSGHPLLRKAAEDAARRARFTTTYLSSVPVKVTGVIIYNFKKN